VKRNLILSLGIVVLAILIMSLPGSMVYAQSPTEERESIYVYGGGPSVFIKAAFTDSAYLYGVVTSKTGLVSSSGVKSISLSFVRVSDWKPSFNYFLDGVWYRNTGIYEVPSTSVVLKIVIENGVTEQDVLSIAKTLSNYFLLDFRLASVDSNTYIFYSPYEHGTVYENVLSIIEDEPVAVFDWVSLKNFDKKDFYNVTIGLDVGRHTASFVASYIIYREKGVETLSDVLEWKPNENDTRKINLYVLSKYARVTGYPKLFYNLSVLEESTLYVSLNGYTYGNAEEDPFEIRYTFAYPTLYIERSFNDTQLSNGDVIEVTLKVENIGEADAYNVTLSESRWWDDNQVLFLEGDVKEFFTVIPKATSRVIKYKVKVNTAEPVDVIVPQAQATASIMENVNLTYYSSSVLIHLNRDSPFLSISIDSKTSSVKPGDEYLYDLSVKNEGSETAEDLQLGDFLIKSLAPGESRRVELSTAVSGPWDLIKYVSAKVVYSFQNKTYSLESPSYPVLFKPDTILAPLTSIEITYKSVDNTHIEATLNVKNIGVIDIESLKIEGQLLSGLEYVSGDFEVEPNGTIFYIAGIALGRGSEVEYEAVFKIVSDDVFMYPLVRVEAKAVDISISRLGLIDVFFNHTIEITTDLPSSPLLIGKSYVYKIRVANLGSSDIYNILFHYTNIPEGLTMNSSDSPIGKIAGGSSLDYEISFYAERPGDVSIPPVDVDFILGGKTRYMSIPVQNVTFVYGLKATLSLTDNEILENGATSILIRFESDAPSYIDYIDVSITLPEGLEFSDGTRIYETRISLSSPTLDFTTPEIHAVTPGKYNVSNVKISYGFKGEEITLELQFDITSSNILTVKENVLNRYFIYFIIALAVSIAIAVYIRRSLR